MYVKLPHKHENHSEDTIKKQEKEQLAIISLSVQTGYYHHTVK